MTRIGLVGCGRLKLGHPAPARELYVSQLFRKASAYAEATCDRWYVLSAKHGLVRPDQVVEPYDVRLGGPHGVATVRWGKDVCVQLYAVLTVAEQPHLIVLAGEQYRTFLHSAPWPYTVPMAGMGIGQQLSWLSKQLEAAASAS